MESSPRQVTHFQCRLVGYFTSPGIGIGLYRDVWIAAIASSRTRLATLTGAKRHNANYVRYA